MSETSLVKQFLRTNEIPEVLCYVPQKRRPLEERGTHFKLCENAETKVGSQVCWFLPELPKQVKWRNSGPPTNSDMIANSLLFSKVKILIISRKD